jgi:hypothetical protein
MSGSETVDPRQKRIQQNQALFREGRELLERRAETLRNDFVCECGDPECWQLIALTMAEYERVRTSDGLLAVAVGHENGGESVVERNDRYVLVRKTP